MIRDQRTMQGAGQHSEVFQVEAAWHAVAMSARGFVNAPAGQENVLTERHERLDAYVSDGRWVADCAACGGGIATWIENPRGCCLDCGSVFRIKHPSRNAVADGEALLMARDRSNRNWKPAVETVADLKVENLTHAVSIV